MRELLSESGHNKDVRYAFIYKMDNQLVNTKLALKKHPTRCKNLMNWQANERNNLVQDERASLSVHRRHKLLVLDTSYTLEMVRERGLDKPILSRDLDGFFEHVWSVHPFATLLTSEAWGPRYGKPATYQMATRHTVLEGKVGRFAALKWLFPVNFFLGQLELFILLWRLVRREKITAVRAPSPLYTGLFGLALARAAGVPLVIRVGANHDKIFATTGKPLEPRLMRSRRVEKIVEKFVFSRADLVAGANQDNLDFALANGAKPEKATLFRYGNLIHDSHFVPPSKRTRDGTPLSDLGIERDKFILNVARLEQSALKHPEDLLYVLAWLRDRAHNIKLVLVGDGRLKSEIISRAQDLGIGEHVVLTGNRGQTWLASIIPEAAVFVSPHSGRALSEAALGSAPVVAYDVDWQRELIETNATGILVPYRAWEEMAAGVERMLTSPSFAREMGDALRKRALAMLDPDNLNEHERGEYRKLFARFELAGR